MDNKVHFNKNLDFLQESTCVYNLKNFLINITPRVNFTLKDLEIIKTSLEENENVYFYIMYIIFILGQNKYNMLIMNKN